MLDLHIHSIFSYDAMGRPEKIVEKVISYFLSMGGDGIEAYQGLHTEEQTRELVQLAEEYGIPVSGGSDCHGCNAESAMLIGRKIPYGILNTMKDCLHGQRGVSL